ncbi:hypothetical protein [Halorussus lipolyticus]|uniref:hypothetical protein n=1 Tax=Halorussus lipolyticus TaxID=3034024 RepID=UPI0023E8F03A|nr:hypothetical protein [Halorussus sp. DT80]
MIDLTDLQEDILTLAVEHPDKTNEEIAAILDCSPDWVGDVRRDYEHKVNENQVTDELNTVSGTASNPPAPSTNEESEGTDRTMEIVLATGLWWMPIIIMLQGGQPPVGAWAFFGIGWIGVPAAVFLDAKGRGSIGGGLIYTIASVCLPMVAGLVYLSRRE